MSSMGISLIAFMVIASLIGLVFLGSLWYLSGKELRFTTRSFAMLLLVPLLLGAAIFAFFSFMEFHEQPVLCGDYCHAMDPVYESYLEPGNNSVMLGHVDEGVTCLDCHTGPGLWGQVEVYFAVPHEAWSEVSGNYEPEDLGGQVTPDFCTKCHDGETATFPGNVTSALGTQVNPHSIEADCVDCHTPHEHNLGIGDHTCGICHGLTIQYFDEKLEAHGERVGQECMDCHYRLHPEQAQIPWASVPDLIDTGFCSDCHPEIVDAYTSSATPASLELYGECVDCHSEHNESLPPHQVYEGFEDCGQCHVNFAHLTLMHNRTGITYLDVPGVDDAFCSDCHKRYNPPSVHTTVTCESCHSDHYLRVRFDDCASCHEEIPSFHDAATQNCVNDDCHGSWFYHG